jgi:adenylate kinase family enzyme
MDKPMVQSESVYVDGHSYGRLRGRPDDRPDVAKRRVDAYLAQTWPVVSYYEARGLLHRIDGSQSVDRVQQQIVEALRPQPHDVEARAGQ